MAVGELQQQVFKHEAENTASVSKPAKPSMDEEDWAACNFMQWFVKEQTEEETLAMDLLVRRLPIVGGQKVSKDALASFQESKSCSRQEDSIMSTPDSPSPEKRIVVSENGPYLVSGGVPLRIQNIVPNKEGMSWDWKDGRTFEVGNEYALCRCGHSQQMPFCDGNHAKFGFEGKETASRIPFSQRAERIEGPTLILSDVQDLCAFARFCDPGGKIWGLIGQTDDSGTRALAIREAMHCPAGRLVLHDEETRKEIEDALEPAIGIVEDPALGCSGPLWVQGGIAIESSDGRRYEKRNRVTLCRCGASDTKPFCNGSHASMKFHDGLMKETKAKLVL
jgi:CDGSH-type Zn-finger protein